MELLHGMRIVDNAAQFGLDGMDRLEEDEIKDQ